jgi:mRNA-degrading endonuclease RelE of RelBE toxin-antitoxin system
LQEDIFLYAKKLKDPRFGEYRFRVGDYRVFFDVDKRGGIKILLILEVKHRRESYR